MDIKIFADIIDWKAKEQIYAITEQAAFADAKVRVMPDCHAGAGCVVGFTSTMGDKVIPDIIGVDIGCGMRVTELGKIDIDFEKLDEFIKKNIPSGMEVNKTADKRGIAIINELYCKNELKNMSWLECSMGSLGGGNHFIEVDSGDDGLYLVIHSGSRNVGKQVAEYYQKLAVKRVKLQSKEEREESEKLIARLKAEGRQRDIPDGLKAIKLKYRENTRIPDDLCYLEGKDKDDYMHDMRLCQKFAVLNRTEIADRILKFLGVARAEVWESVHNYIDDKMIIRKGAIAAHKGQRVIIPLNMRDGCVIGIGKGDPDWNMSAPHGAGRVMSRAEAKRTLSVGEFQEQMKDVFSTTVGFSTIDESPMAYKPTDGIIELIKQNVDITRIIKPLYNFKAADE